MTNAGTPQSNDGTLKIEDRTLNDWPGGYRELTRESSGPPDKNRRACFPVRLSLADDAVGDRVGLWITVEVRHQLQGATREERGDRIVKALEDYLRDREEPGVPLKCDIDLGVSVSSSGEVTLNRYKPAE